MTLKAYLDALRWELVSRYGWARDRASVERYMTRVEEGLADKRAGMGAGYEYTGAASVAAWRAIGGKGTPSLKALRGLV